MGCRTGSTDGIRRRDSTYTKSSIKGSPSLERHAPAVHQVHPRRLRKGSMHQSRTMPATNFRKVERNASSFEADKEDSHFHIVHCDTLAMSCRGQASQVSLKCLMVCRSIIRIRSNVQRRHSPRRAPWATSCPRDGKSAQISKGYHRAENDTHVEASALQSEGDEVCARIRTDARLERRRKLTEEVNKLGEHDALRRSVLPPEVGELLNQRLDF